MSRGKLTIADLRALKKVRQLSMLRVESIEEAAAAEQAGIDMISVAPQLLKTPHFLEVAPTVFCVTSLSYGVYATANDYLRASLEARRSGADAIYCAASMRVVRRLAEEGVPVCGHVGLIPSIATWTGGFKAVGKTLESALFVMRQVMELENAGAVMAEIEVVPSVVAAEISNRTTLLLLSMGSGAGCDGQYLFATDILGAHKGHYPRHSKTYRNFAAELDRLQVERVNAFREFASDIASGAFPAAKHSVDVDPKVLKDFVAELDKSPLEK